MYIILLVIKCESFGVRMLVRPFWKKQNMAVFQFFFNWDSLHARLNSHYKAWSYKKMSVNSTLKAIQIIGQRKTFYRQRIPESSCARKETASIDILVTSRNGDRQIIQSIRIASRPPTRERKWNHVSQLQRTSTKVIPTEKTYAGHISTMSQGFKRSSKKRTNSPAYTFLQLV